MRRSKPLLLVLRTLAALLALSTGWSLHPLTATQKTYIHEFTHPRVIVHYHPIAGEQFTLDHVRFALSHEVHAIELDLHWRDDGQVVVNHDNATAESPTLTQVVDLILQQKKEEVTVNHDSRQFFLVLEPKENDPRLLDGVFQILTHFTDHLSTAVGAEEGPRGITVVITGEHLRTFYSRFPASQLNRLCIVEGHEYGSEIVNLSREQIPFQWVDAVEHNEKVNEGGRINTLHAGTDPEIHGQSNVRIWACHDELSSCLATGADEINVDRNELELFQRMIEHQDFQGRFPALSIHGVQALLTWRDVSNDGLYVSFGTVDPSGLNLPRQILLTSFLADMPVAQTASVALLPDGRLLIVYHGGNPQGLWYLSGRFTSPDRFLTFDGNQHRLMLTDDSSRRGRNPALAVAPDGRVIVVYEGVADQELWYFSGFVSATGELAGQEYRLMRGNAANQGHSPAIGISAQNHVLVSYQGIDGETLLYLSGTIDSAGRIAGREFSLGEPQARQLGCAPSVAFGPERRIVIAYQGLQGQVIEGVSGTLDADGRIVGQGFSWDQGEPKRGIHPTASFDVRGNVFIVYEGVEDHKFRYVLGSWDQSGRLLGEEKLLSSGMDRR